MVDYTIQAHYLAQFEKQELSHIHNLAAQYMRDKREIKDATVAGAWLEAVLHYLLKKNLLMPIKDSINGAE